MKIFEVVSNEKSSVSYGYKIMADMGKQLASIANTDIKFEKRIGAIHSIGGNGLYIANTKDYAIDYYADSTEYPDVLVTYEFHPEDIIRGNYDDRESELTIKKAKVVDITPLDK